mgnify:CR=1 FL=1
MTFIVHVLLIQFTILPNVPFVGRKETHFWVNQQYFNPPLSTSSANKREVNLLIMSKLVAKYSKLLSFIQNMLAAFYHIYKGGRHQKGVKLTVS